MTDENITPVEETNVSAEASEVSPSNPAVPQEILDAQAQAAKTTLEDAHTESGQALPVEVETPAEDKPLPTEKTPEHVTGEPS